MAKPEMRAQVYRTSSYQEMNGEAARFGGVIIETARGPIGITDAPGYMTSLVDHADPSLIRIGFILYEPPGPGDAFGQGMLAQMDPEQARNIAQSLMRLADTIDERASHA